ncbi:MAG: SPASM domain-containing protein [Parachlamydiaceae bacterium]|nr:SPASM domain-containing protein [Parachlamydiaceae bacterium]
MESNNFHIELYLTRDCNLRCTYCFEGHHGKEKTRKKNFEMSLETANKALEFLFKRIDKKFDKISINFFGGEVMQDMDRLIQFTQLADHFSKIHSIPLTKIITTNGSFLTSKNYDLLEKNNIYYLISLDGNQKTHDKFRVFSNGQGSFNHIWRNKNQILKGIESGRCRKCLFTVMPEILQDLIEATKFLIDQGFKNILYNFAMDKFSIWDEKSLLYLSDSISVILEYSDKHNATIYPFHYLRDELINPTLNEEDNGEDLRCGILTKVVAIDFDGTILPCTRFADGKVRKFAIGNVFSEEFNKPLIAYLTNIKKNIKSKCNSCVYKKTCVTYCPMLAIDQTNAYEPPKVMCDINFTIHRAIEKAL